MKFRRRGPQVADWLRLEHALVASQAQVQWLDDAFDTCRTENDRLRLSAVTERASLSREAADLRARLAVAQAME
jgi:hypothetical protein